MNAEDFWQEFKDLWKDSGYDEVIIKVDGYFWALKDTYIDETHKAIVIEAKHIDGCLCHICRTRSFGRTHW